MKEKIERELNLTSDGSGSIDGKDLKIEEEKPEIEDVMIESKDLLAKPIVESEKFVSILGVRLPKGIGGLEAPTKTRFADIERSLTNEDLRLMQKIALALKLSQPILIEEYSGSGKTTKVEHICALTENSMFYANCHDFDTDVLIGKMTTDEKTKSGFGWQDGIVMKAVRNGGILFLDEYNFMRGETRARMHEILDALLRGKEKISLIENNGELVEVNPNLRIVAAQNPPGGEFGNREVLDPAQYTRFIQIKGPSRMSKETKLARTLGFLGKDNAITIPKEDYLLSEARLTPEQLAEIDGVEEIFEKFVEFEEGVEEMVAKRKAGADQPQPIYFAFQRDLERVRQFVQMFFNGDINETFQKALKYYYVERFESEADRLKIEEMIKKVAYMPKDDSSRRGLTDREKAKKEKEERERMKKEKKEADEKAKLGVKKPKEKTKDIIDSVSKSRSIPDTIKDKIDSVKEKVFFSESITSSEAKEILKQDFLGKEEIEKALNIEIDETSIPEIPFSREDIERAKELNQFLILRTDKIDKKTPLTMENINKHLKGKTKDGGKILYSGDETGKIKDDAWYKPESLLKETPILSWALVSKEVIPESTSKNYLEQTELIIKYLKEKVYKDTDTPEVYQQAITEFEKEKEEIAGLIKTDWKKAAEKLEKLQINQLTRQTPIETIYNLIAYLHTNNQRLLENKATWTKRRFSDGRLVHVGHFDADGAYLYCWLPDRSHGDVGVSFSRSL